MRTTILLIILLINFTIKYSFSQSGIYRCNYYEFKNEVDPAYNAIETDEKKLILDLDAIGNKYVMWRLPNKENKSDGDVFLKWNVKSVSDAKYFKDKNYVQTKYEVKTELSGVELDEIKYLYKIDDLNNKTLTIIVYNPKSNTRQFFYNLVAL